MAQGTTSAWSSYNKLKSLSHGGYGQVFVCEGVPEEGGIRGFHVAKRVFVQGFSPKELKAAMTEVQVLKHMSHHHVVKALDDFYDDEGYLNIIMELADNGDLGEWIKNKAANSDYVFEQDLMQMASQMLLGLQYIHCCCIIHCDLKPPNIVLTRDKSLKIADFGMARSTLDGGDRKIMEGTPNYLAPELMDSKPFTTQCDVWALGCIIYELATFQKAFPGDNVMAVISAINVGQYKPIPTFYSTSLKSMIGRMLMPDHKERSSVDDILQLFFPASDNENTATKFQPLTPYQKPSDMPSNSVEEFPSSSSPADDTNGNGDDGSAINWLDRDPINTPEHHKEVNMACASTSMTAFPGSNSTSISMTTSSCMTDSAVNTERLPKKKAAVQKVHIPKVFNKHSKSIRKNVSSLKVPKKPEAVSTPQLHSALPIVEPISASKTGESTPPHVEPTSASKTGQSTPPLTKSNLPLGNPEVADVPSFMATYSGIHGAKPRPTVVPQASMQVPNMCIITVVYFLTSLLKAERTFGFDRESATSREAKYKSLAHLIADIVPQLHSILIHVMDTLKALHIQVSEVISDTSPTEQYIDMLSDVDLLLAQIHQHLDNLLHCYGKYLPDMKEIQDQLQSEVVSLCGELSQVAEDLCQKAQMVGSLQQALHQDDPGLINVALKQILDTESTHQWEDEFPSAMVETARTRLPAYKILGDIATHLGSVVTHLQGNREALQSVLQGAKAMVDGSADLFKASGLEGEAAEKAIAQAMAPILKALEACDSLSASNDTLFHKSTSSRSMQSMVSTASQRSQRRNSVPPGEHIKINKASAFEPRAQSCPGPPTTQYMDPEDIGYNEEPQILDLRSPKNENLASNDVAKRRAVEELFSLLQRALDRPTLALLKVATSTCNQWLEYHNYADSGSNIAKTSDQESYLSHTVDDVWTQDCSDAYQSVWASYSKMMGIAPPTATSDGEMKQRPDFDHTYKELEEVIVNRDQFSKSALKRHLKEILSGSDQRRNHDSVSSQISHGVSESNADELLGAQTSGTEQQHTPPSEYSLDIPDGPGNQYNHVPDHVPVGSQYNDLPDRAVVRLKVHFTDMGTSCLQKIPKSCSFDLLHSILQDLEVQGQKIGSRPIAIRYKDSDGDLICVEDGSDWDEMIFQYHALRMKAKSTKGSAPELALYVSHQLPTEYERTHSRSRSLTPTRSRSVTPTRSGLSPKAAHHLSPSAPAIPAPPEGISDPIRPTWGKNPNLELHTVREMATYRSVAISSTAESHDLKDQSPTPSPPNPRNPVPSSSNLVDYTSAPHSMIQSALPRSSKLASSTPSQRTPGQAHKNMPEAEAMRLAANLGSLYSDPILFQASQAPPTTLASQSTTQTSQLANSKPMTMPTTKSQLSSTGSRIPPRQQYSSSTSRTPPHHGESRTPPRHGEMSEAEAMRLAGDLSSLYSDPMLSQTPPSASSSRGSARGGRPTTASGRGGPMTSPSPSRKAGSNLNQRSVGRGRGTPGRVGRVCPNLPDSSPANRLLPSIGSSPIPKARVPRFR